MQRDSPRGRRTQDAVAVYGAGRDVVGAMQELGKLLVILGGVILLLGLVLWSGFGTNWLGRLPGDIRIERGHSAFYFPIVTCIILSILLSLLFALFRR